MQEAPLGADHVVDVVRADLSGRIDAAPDAGVDRRLLAIDPGLGFGKAAEASLRLMRDVQAFLDFGLPLVMGPSRKSFIGLALEQAPVDDRLEGSAAAVAYLAARGAHIVRVHDVREMVRVVRVVDAITGS
jgi:dihydropteroate synthase